MLTTPKIYFPIYWNVLLGGLCWKNQTFGRCKILQKVEVCCTLFPHKAMQETVTTNFSAGFGRATCFD